MQLLPGVTEDMLTADGWIERITDHSVYDVRVCRLAFERSPDLYELRQGRNYDIVPPKMSATPLFDRLGRAISDSDWSDIVKNSKVKSVTPVPGFTVQPAGLRRWAAPIEGYRQAGSAEFDALLDTTLHTLEPVVIVGESRDSSWYYVYSRTYRGFVAANQIARTDWSSFERYRFPHSFAVVTVPKTITEPQPYDLAVTGRIVEFGAVLPLTDVITLGNQLRIGHSSVLLPVQSDDGTLEMHPAYLPHSDVHVGWLQLSRPNCLSLAFSLLFERYGWGGHHSVHDCSSFVMDVYRAMGIQLPRDAGAQEQSLFAPVSFSPDLSETERLDRLRAMQAGDLLYMPGHVMMYLGMVEDRPYVLHDFKGYVADGREVDVNQVMVSTLDIQTSRGETYLSLLTTGGAVMVR